MSRSGRLLLVLVLAARPLAGQGNERVTGGGIFESYSFDAGYVVGRVSELTIPVGWSVDLGSRASLVLSTGYVAVELETADPAQLPDQRLDGPMDTELRLDVTAVENRLMAFLAARVPTGRKSFVDDQFSLLVALSNDAIGYSAPSLGSGGGLTGGFSVAVPVGRFALGAAATASYSFPYEPVVAQAAELSPGAEARLRLGLEGALTGRTYLRLAASAAARAKDRLDGSSAHGLGRRLIGYATLEQGLGPVLLTLYGFDVYRGSPQLESTALGAAILPRGNLLAGGGSLTLRFGAITFSPSAEYRVAWAAATADASMLDRQATSLRVGGELRRALGPHADLALRGQGAFGEVMQVTEPYGFHGFLAAATLVVTP